MDLNEQLKSWIAEQQQPGSFFDKAGLGLAQAGQTLAQDAGTGAAILNDPRNSWIGMNPLGRVAAEGLGLVGMLKPFYHGTTKPAADAIQRGGFALEKALQGADVQPGGMGAQWLGKGVYLAEDPHTANVFAHTVGVMHQQPPAVIKALIDDEKLLNMKDPRVWDDLVKEMGWPESYKGYARDSSYTHKLFSMDINKYAQDKGLKGVVYPDETVIFDPSIIQVEGKAP
jgi:hypothetical protein